MTEIRPGTVIAGRYTVHTSKGRGGSSRTWLATDKSSGSTVVLKILSVAELREWKTLELFSRESELLQRLDHPGIPDYIDYRETELSGVPVRILAQEHADGDDLHVLVKKNRHFPPEEVHRILTEMLRILEYIHSLHPPLLHRDIKPENIVIDKQGKVYLVDFSGAGAGRVTSEEAGRSDTFVGTAGYMPPEQYYGQTYPQSDLYALGVTMIFLLTGKEPSEMALTGGRPDLSSIHSLPGDLRELIEVCTAQDWRDRPVSARRALELLERHSLVAEAVKADRWRHLIHPGPSRTLLRRHLTVETPNLPGKSGLLFFVNLVEQVCDCRGRMYPRLEAASLEWMSSMSPTMTVCVSRHAGRLRIDAIQPVLSGGWLIMMGTYSAFMAGYLVEALPWLHHTFLPAATAPQQSLLLWVVLTVFFCVIYSGTAWFHIRFRFFRVVQQLVQMLHRLPDGLKASSYPELLKQPPFGRSGKSHPFLSTNIQAGLTSKWRLSDPGKTHDDIHAALERILVYRRGEIISAGLGLRWTHKKSPWTVSFQPCGQGTKIEFAVDRRHYGPFYTVVLFVLGFIGWLILGDVMNEALEAGEILLPGGLLMGLAVPALGMLINLVLSFFHSLRGRSLVRKLVHELEDRP